METERIMLYAIMAIVITLLLLLSGRRKQLAKGEKHTYDTALKHVFYIFFLPFFLAIITLAIVETCISLLMGQEASISLMILFFLFFGNPAPFYVTFTLVAILYIWSLLHSLRHYNTCTNVMYWAHVVNIVLMLATTVVCLLNGY